MNIETAGGQPTRSADNNILPTPLLGKRVVINGLVAKPELNGRTGTAVSFDDDKGRYSVELGDTSSSLMIKPCNLRELFPEEDAEWKETQKVLKEAYRKGVQTATLTCTSGTRPTGFHLLQDAQVALMALGAGGAMKGERKYYAYYEDLKRDTDSWRQFLGECGNNVFAERSCGILGTLATILRQRSEFSEAEAVLEMEGLILPLYQRHAFAAAGEVGVSCFEELEYKYNVIRYNLYFQTARRERCAQLLRSLAAHEIKRQYSFDSQQFAYLIPAVFKVSATLGNLSKLTDADLQKVIDYVQRESDKLASLGGAPHTADKAKADKKTCAGCEQKEEFRGDFNLCAGCKKVAYCGKQCQKAHWKTHKQRCASK